MDLLSPKPVSRRNYFLFAAVTLSVILLFRAFSLDVVDLLDPTESRYAFVAQEMAESGDWLTPKLPMKEGVIPYLGKPPLHFWLTAAFYKVFGVHECTSRIVSFFSYMMIAFFAAVFANRFYNMHIACLSATIVLSSFLLFFLSGSSGVDVTLTAAITAALVLFALQVDEQDIKKKKALGLIFFFCVGLSFMVKGPIGLVLTGIPICVWTLIERKWSAVFRLPWIAGVLIFALVTLPWFIAAEIHNPGFIKYFFINENFGRFLYTDYGDKYGTGHIYVRGSSWYMLIAMFLPWSFFCLFALVKDGKELITLVKHKDPWLKYLVIWALTPALFFTFARQLLLAYLLPSAAALGIITSALLFRYEYSHIDLKGLARKFLISCTILAVLVSLSGVVVGIVLGTLGISVYIGFAITVCLMATIHYALKQNLDLIQWSYIKSISLATCFVVVTICVGSYASNRKSTESILLEITNDLDIPVPTVGIAHDNAYSAFFYGKAWMGQLESPVNVIYVDPYNPSHSGPKELIAKPNKINENTAPFFSHYKLIKTIGSWSWFERGEGQGNCKRHELVKG